MTELCQWQIRILSRALQSDVNAFKISRQRPLGNFYLSNGYNIPSKRGPYLKVKEQLNIQDCLH